MDTIPLNTQAVVLMQQGSFQEAISVFRTAISELLRRPADDDHQQEGMETTDNATPNLLSVRSVPLEYSLLNTSSCQDHHACSLFDRPLVIDGAELATVYAFDAVESCVSAVIFFNMGLALQLQGTQNVGPLQTSYLKALRFYKMATEILDRCTNSDDEVNCLLLYLAVANNMGQIHSTFCETSKAQQCLEWLQTILEAAKDSDGYILGDERNPFLMNVLIAHWLDAAAAAAA
jgi:tetratricopeptide (TPR) repeat protein